MTKKCGNIGDDVRLGAEKLVRKTDIVIIEVN